MSYKWRFFKTARLVQASVDNGEALANLKDLDQKLWTVLSMSVDGLVFDKRTLEFLDSDNDGRIRAPELIAAVEWLKLRLKSLDIVFRKDGDLNTLPFDAINDSTQEGRELLDSLKKISSQNGNGEAKETTLADVTSIGKVFAGTPFNGDGVVTPLSASDDAVSEVVKAVISAEGAIADRSGADGINQEKIDAFFADASAYVAWCETKTSDPSILFLGDATDGAYTSFVGVEEKIDAFFTPPEDMPLVTDVVDPELALTSNLHPLWISKFTAFAKIVAAPVLGRDEVTSITRGEWDQIKSKFAPYRKWLQSKSGANVEAIGCEKLSSWLKDGAMKKELDELIVKDLAFANSYDRLVDAEKAIRYIANLEEIVQNYVNQARLYNPETQSVFQTGTLYIDSRACSLCFHVANLAAHSALAVNSKCCILYVKLSRKKSAETKDICAIVTAGKTAPLYVGRNGVFYDRDGNDWDAVITKIVEAQVSLSEAFWSPWKKMGTLVGDQVKKFLTAKQTAATTQVGGVINGMAVPPKPAPAATDASNSAFTGNIAMLSIGVGMLGAAFAGFVGIVAGLPCWKVLLGIAAIVLSVSLPSVILAWLKLRSRDLGVVLNAGGWAVNRPLYFGVALAKLFTRSVKYEAKVSVARDPYASKTPIKIIIALIVIGVLAVGGYFLFAKCVGKACENTCGKNTVAEKAQLEKKADVPATGR
jgi:hypothetical protein